MSATVITAIVSTVTTALMAYVVRLIRNLVKSVARFKTEHEFLMTNTRNNTVYIKRVMQHLNMED